MVTKELNISPELRDWLWENSSEPVSALEQGLTEAGYSTVEIRQIISWFINISRVASLGSRGAFFDSRWIEAQGYKLTDKKTGSSVPLLAGNERLSFRAKGSSSYELKVTPSAYRGTTSARVMQGIERVRNRFGLTPKIVFSQGEPQIFIVDGLISIEDCDALIQESVPSLKRSTVVNNTGGADLEINERTSLGTFIRCGSSELIKRVDAILSEVFGYPEINGESLQILNYKTGAEYKPHYDYFDPTTAGGSKQIGSYGNRTATIILYLNDVPSGGETCFPERKINVHPKKGSVLYFDYPPTCMANGTAKLTLHGGRPVVAGEKWIATRWVREFKFTG